MGNILQCASTQESAEEFDFHYNILLLGDSGVGKSSLIEQATSSKFSLNRSPTIGCNYKSFQIVLSSKKTAKLTLIDSFAYQTFLQCITPSMLNKLDAIIYCYSVVQKNSFYSMLICKSRVEELIKQNEIHQQPLSYVVANKTDLAPNTVTPNPNELNANNCFKTSCQFGFNVQGIFKQIAEQLNEKISLNDQRKNYSFNLQQSNQLFKENQKSSSSKTLLH